MLEGVEAVLAAEGAGGVLALLNARVPHRFTGVYRLDPPVLRNVRLYDRHNPRLVVGADAPLRETYCSIVAESASPLLRAVAPLLVAALSLARG